MVIRIVAHPSDQAPPLDTLATAATAEGFHFVERTAQEWAAGINRFDGPGEVFLLALANELTVGMCGLNVDPYAQDPAIGRLRHLYVLPGHRRQGIGAQLVSACLRHAQGFRRVRLRTTDPVAHAFYLTQGFTPVTEAEATHAITIEGQAG